MNNSKITVDLKNKEYDIIIGNNIIDNEKDIIKNILPINKCFVVTDDNVAPIALNNLKKNLDNANINFDVEILPAGEKTKSFKFLENLLDKIFQFAPERKITLIALGGGVIGDLTGFTASILLRGVNFIQIPTTLLAMVDSSIGGKTAINNKFGKNLIGCFHQPSLVISDIEYLKKLPDRQFKAGYAEVVKYGLIKKKNFFEWLDNNIDKILNKDNEAINYIISESCKTKAEIVAEDEKEKDVRALLNLGHTFGHALEAATGYSDELLHGEGVSIGIIFAMLLSEKLNLITKEDINIVKEHLIKIGLPTSPLEIRDKWNADELLNLMFKDKKVNDGNLVFILLNNIGDAFIKKDVEQNLVLDTIKEVI